MRNCILNRKLLHFLPQNIKLTIVDGKVCNALTETSSAKCHICGALPTKMKLATNSELHANIRFFEYFIPFKYELELKKMEDQ